MATIFFTGASSFSGSAFVRELSARGHRILCCFGPESPEAYDELRRRRAAALLALPGVEPLWGVRLADPAVAAKIREESVSAFCHHAADVTDYKSPNYDIARGVKNNTEGLVPVLDALAVTGGCAVLTGTFSEPGEGWGGGSLPTFNPYSLAKNFTWEISRHHAQRKGVRIRKFVMGTPFGPWEGRGFTSYLAGSWLSGRTPSVKTPDYVRDTVPVTVMAAGYAAAVSEGIASREMEIKRTVSGFSGSNGELTAWLSANLASHLGVPTPFVLEKQADFSEPMFKTLGPPGLNCHVPTAFWEELATYYKKELLPR